jgi:hypothetical protein
MDRRLHRSAIGAEALTGLRGAALPLLIAVFIGGSGGDVVVRLLFFGLLGLVFSVGFAALQWTTTAGGWTATSCGCAAAS